MVPGCLQVGPPSQAEATCGAHGARGAGTARGPAGAMKGFDWISSEILVGGLEHLLFSHILGIIIPID